MTARKIIAGELIPRPQALLPAVHQSAPVARIDDSTARLITRRLDRWINERNRFGGSKDPISRTYFARDVRLYREELDSLFEHDWLSRRVIEVHGKDATREWITLSHDSDPDKAEAVRTELDRLNARELFQEAITLGRLYGGNLMVLGVFDGRVMEQPMEPEAVREVSFVHNVDRFRAWPLSWHTDPEDPRFGEVETYTIQEISVAAARTMVVHASRTIRFDGHYTPLVPRLRNFGWQSPVLQNFYEALRQFGVSVQSGSAVLQDFVTKKLKIQNLRDLIASDDWETIYARLSMVAAQQAINNLAVYGDDEEIEKMGTPVTGLHQLMELFIDYVSAAAEIPKSRLFGNQSGALGGDQGKNDLRSHYDNMAAFQENSLRGKLRRFIDVVSVPLGIAPGEIDFTFNPLWQPTDAEIAEVYGKTATADAAYINAGVLEPEEVATSRFGGDGINFRDVNIDVERRERILKELSTMGRPEPVQMGLFPDGEQADQSGNQPDKPNG